MTREEFENLINLIYKNDIDNEKEVTFKDSKCFCDIEDQDLY